MSFDSLSHTFEFDLPDFPDRWLPLTYLYDPDLPLFPLLYFHILDPRLPAGERAGETDRAYGYVQSVDRSDRGFRALVCLNKDLQSPANEAFHDAVYQEVRERLGLGCPVVLSDIDGRLTGQLAGAGPLLRELWFKAVDRSFGRSLPFGRMWDATLGLVRFVASWNSPGGRKGELIETHCFASDFGEQVQSRDGYNVDFYLLPAFDELTNPANPLSLFPKFRRLADAASGFQERYCTVRELRDGLSFSAFNFRQHSTERQLNTACVVDMWESAPNQLRDSLFKSYGAFDRGPARSVLFLMMLDDLRNRRWVPTSLTREDCKSVYTDLKGSYQSPKVIHLYGQQCFALSNVLPIDLWVRSFLQHPFVFRPTVNARADSEVFDYSDNWGRIERLLWIVAQARKVHSSTCADILWCVRYGGEGRVLRGAGPLSCKLCANVVREVCPAYESVSDLAVSFNGADEATDGGASFNVTTSEANNTSSGQTFVSCEGARTLDSYSPRDMPQEFSSYPVVGHDGAPMSVAEFIARY